MYKYWEELPQPTCPPQDAEDVARGGLWRAVENKPPKCLDFRSNGWLADNKIAKRQKPADVTECEWRSCSFFDDIKRIERKMSLPGLRGKTPVRVDLPQGVSRSRSGQSGHVDVWFYADCDPCAHVKP